MHLCLYIVATLAAASAAAFRVPEGATDGIYAAYYDESGNEVHVKDPNPITVAGIVSGAAEVQVVKKSGVSRARRSSSPSELFKRATVWCGCGFHLNQIDCDGAVQQIKDGIQNAGGQSDVGPGLAWYAIRGNVVVFLCNRYGPGRGRITVAGFTAALATITSACGYYVAGTIDNGVLDIGYMNDDPNVWFCERARWSTRHEC